MVVLSANSSNSVSIHFFGQFPTVFFCTIALDCTFCVPFFILRSDPQFIQKNALLGIESPHEEQIKVRGVGVSFIGNSTTFCCSDLGIRIGVPHAGQSISVPKSSGGASSFCWQCGQLKVMSGMISPSFSDKLNIFVKILLVIA